MALRLILGIGRAYRRKRTLCSTSSLPKLDLVITTKEKTVNLLVFTHAKENELHNNNQFLRAKIAEKERAQQQHMSLMPGSSDYDLVAPQHPFDGRNYLQVNDLQPNNNYSRQDQTPLQLV